MYIYETAVARHFHFNFAGVAQTQRGKDQTYFKSKCLDITVQFLGFWSIEAHREIRNWKDRPDKPWEYLLYEQHHSDSVYGHRVSIPRCECIVEHTYRNHTLLMQL